MTLVTDLDSWTSTLASTVGIPATRDPDLIHPPCILVGLPEITAMTLPSVTLNVPVWLVAPGAGLVAGDSLLTYLTDVLAAVAEKTATDTTLTIAGVDYHAYQTTAHLHVTL